MNIMVDNAGTACSTLVAHSLANIDHAVNGGDFEAALKKAVVSFTNDAKQHRRSDGDFVFGWSWFHNYAHLLFSVTDQKAFSETREALEAAGAVKTEAVYNGKNKTRCILYILPIPKVLEMVDYKDPTKKEKKADA